MEQSSTDRRVRKTKKQLRLALMELLAEKKRQVHLRAGADRAGGYQPRHLLYPLPGRGGLLQRLEDEMAIG